MQARVAFSRAATAGSLMIRAAQSPTLAPWSHACSVLPDGRVVEALAARGKVVISEWAELVERSSRIEVLAIEVPDHDSYLAAVLDQVGRHYGYREAFGAWLGTRRLDGRGLYCSHAVAAALLSGGVDLLAPGTRGVLPWALYRLMWAAGARPGAPKLAAAWAG